MGRKLQLGALLAVLTYASGCTPSYHATLQQIDEIRAIAESARSAAEAATGQTGAAEQMASEAQATANEALAAANAAQACCDATNERVDRIFEVEAAK